MNSNSSNVSLVILTLPLDKHPQKIQSAEKQVRSGRDIAKEKKQTEKGTVVLNQNSVKLVLYVISLVKSSYQITSNPP